MRRVLLAVLLAACGGDDAQTPADAAIDGHRVDAAIDAPRPDGPPTPAIDWSIWGQPCNRPLYGAVTCVGSDGQTAGLCVLPATSPRCTNGVCAGACRHYCYSNPPYTNECPADGKAIEDGSYSQGCHCEQL